MASREQQKQRRYMLTMTAVEAADLVWAAQEGLEQVFSYTDPEVDWGMTEEQFEEWQQRVASAITLLEDTINEGGEIWP